MSLFRKADAALYRAERMVAGLLFLFMALIMFASVTHRVFSREESRLGAMVGGLLGKLGVVLDHATIHGPLSAGLNLLCAFGLSYAALRTMKRDTPLSRGRAAAFALGAALGLAAVVKVMLVALPNGIVWGNVAALACMLWVGFLGASIATYEKRHLALEMGEKIWPESMAPYVRSVGMVVTGLFCLFLVVLAVLSIRDHLAGWNVNHLAGNLLPTDIPKWVVFLILPYTFVVMTLRFLGLAIGALRGESVHEEKIG